jgi:hypothetical protein
MKTVLAFLKVAWDLADDFVLELLRVSLLGAYSSAFAFATDSLNGVKGDWELVAVILGFVLKALDRFLHEKGWAEKGLTRF